MNLSTLKEKASAWWKAHRTDAIRVLAVLGCLLLLMAVFLRAPGKAVVTTAAPAPAHSKPLQGQIDSLRLRVIALENPAQAPEPADPQPPRASAPRAAVRPTQAPAAAPVAPAPRWGTTDLDRAIAAFPSTNPLEPAK